GTVGYNRYVLGYAGPGCAPRAGPDPGLPSLLPALAHAHPRPTGRPRSPPPSGRPPPIKDLSMRVLLWCLLTFYGHGHDGMEPTDRLIPAGWQGNPWGPAANLARKEGKLPPLKDTPLMAQWDQWGHKVLRDGDILFRRGDARILGGWFPFSRFIANISGS